MENNQNQRSIALNSFQKTITNERLICFNRFKSLLHKIFGVTSPSRFFEAKVELDEKSFLKPECLQNFISEAEERAKGDFRPEKYDKFWKKLKRYKA